MARVKSRNSVIQIEDITGASRILSGRSNSATLSFSAGDAREITRYDSGWVERIPLPQKDWQFDVAGIWDGAASQLDEWLSGLVGASTIFSYTPTDVTGYARYTGSGILQDYGISDEYDGPVTWSITIISTHKPGASSNGLVRDSTPFRSAWLKVWATFTPPPTLTHIVGAVLQDTSTANHIVWVRLGNSLITDNGDYILTDNGDRILVT